MEEGQNVEKKNNNISRPVDSGKEQNRDFNKSAKNVEVYAMPQRFHVYQPEAKKAQFTGIFILAGGVIVLIAGLVFFVYLSNRL